MADIMIESAPSNYRKALSYGDAQGNSNRKVDSDIEVMHAARELINAKVSKEEFKQFLDYIDSSDSIPYQMQSMYGNVILSVSEGKLDCADNKACAKLCQEIRKGARMEPELGTDKIISFLIKNFSNTEKISDDETAADAAVDAVLSIGEQAIPALLTAIESKDEKIRLGAIECLSFFGSLSGPENAVIKEEALSIVAESLGKFKVEKKSGNNTGISMNLDCPSGRFLVNLGKRGFPYLKSALLGNDPSAKAGALLGLHYRDTENEELITDDIIRAAVKTLSDYSHNISLDGSGSEGIPVPVLAIPFLASLEKRAVPYVKELLATSDDQMVRVLCGAVLGNMEQENEGVITSEIASLMCKDLGNDKKMALEVPGFEVEGADLSRPEIPMDMLGIQVLSELGNKDMVGPLKELYEKGSPAAKASAACVLAAVDEGLVIDDAVKKILEDPQTSDYQTMSLLKNLDDRGFPYIKGILKNGTPEKRAAAMLAFAQLDSDDLSDAELEEFMPLLVRELGNKSGFLIPSKMLAQMALAGMDYEAVPYLEKAAKGSDKAVAEGAKKVLEMIEEGSGRGF